MRKGLVKGVGTDVELGNRVEVVFAEGLESVFTLGLLADVGLASALGLARAETEGLASALWLGTAETEGLASALGLGTAEAVGLVSALGLASAIGLDAGDKLCAGLCVELAFELGSWLCV